MPTFAVKTGPPQSIDHDVSQEPNVLERLHLCMGEWLYEIATAINDFESRLRNEVYHRTHRKYPMLLQ